MLEHAHAAFLLDVITVLAMITCSSIIASDCAASMANAVIACHTALYMSMHNVNGLCAWRNTCKTCRCTIQLTILGYILVPIFSYDRWWLVLLYAGFMITIAGAEAVSRPSAVYHVSSRV